VLELRRRHPRKGPAMNDIEILRAAAERITAHNVALRSFMLRLLDPEDLGHAVTAEVRQKASALLSMQNIQVNYGKNERTIR
jgi:hypothetical protein